MKTKTEKKIYSLSDINKGKEELLNIINEWEKNEKRRDKIISLLTFAKKWEKTGGGIKTKINDLKKTLRGLKLIQKRTPNDELNKLIEIYEKEYNNLFETVEMKYGLPNVLQPKE